MGAHLALEGCCHVQEQALLADGVGAKQEQAARVEQLSLQDRQPTASGAATHVAHCLTHVQVVQASQIQSAQPQDRLPPRHATGPHCLAAQDLRSYQAQTHDGAVIIVEEGFPCPLALLLTLTAFSTQSSTSCCGGKQ